jgi:hypothetical protein
MHEPTAALTGVGATERPIQAHGPGPTPVEPASMDDPRFLQVLTTEHWSLLTARSLAYNEAFTRASMFLTFLSMSFVGLALAGPPLEFDRSFLVIAAIVLAFDVLIGLLTFVRVANCNVEDLRAMHGMNRIRHGYVQVVPPSARYFVTGTNDDAKSVIASYGFVGSSSPIADVAYGMSTSLGLVGLVLTLVAGTFTGVVALLFDAVWPIPIVLGLVVAVVLLAVSIAAAYRSAVGAQASLPVEFPSDEATPGG